MKNFMMNKLKELILFLQIELDRQFKLINNMKNKSNNCFKKIIINSLIYIDNMQE